MVAFWLLVTPRPNSCWVSGWAKLFDPTWWTMMRTTWTENLQATKLFLEIDKRVSTRQLWWAFFALQYSRWKDQKRESRALWIKPSVYVGRSNYVAKKYSYLYSLPNRNHFASTFTTWMPLNKGSQIHPCKLLCLSAMILKFFILKFRALKTIYLLIGWLANKEANK